LRDPKFSRFDTIPACDVHTHDSIYRASTASRGKNYTIGTSLVASQRRCISWWFSSRLQECRGHRFRRLNLAVKGNDETVRDCQAVSRSTARRLYVARSCVNYVE